MIKQFFVGILTSLLLLFGGTAPTQNLGSTNYVQTQYFTLSGSGVSAGATSVGLKTFHNIDGTNLTMADFGTKGFGTIEPNNGTQEEQITFTGVTQNANGTATLTGVSTCSNKSPYTETSGVSVTHPGGVKFVISNTACFYNTFANKTNAESVSSTWTFFSDPTASSSTHISNDPSAYVTVYAMNQATTTGGSNASVSVRGVVQEATDSMLQSSSSTGSTGARTYANGGSFAQTSTPNKVPVLNGQGQLDKMDIPTSSNFVWTGTHTFSSPVTLTTSTQATTTVTGLLTVPPPTNATDAASLNYVTSSLGVLQGTQTDATFFNYIIPLTVTNTLAGNPIVGFVSSTSDGATHTRFGSFLKSGLIGTSPFHYVTPLIGTSSVNYLDFSDSKTLRIKFRFSASSTFFSPGVYSIGLAPVPTTFEAATTSVLTGVRFIVTATDLNKYSIGCAVGNGSVNQNNSFALPITQALQNNLYEMIVSPTSIQFWVNGTLYQTYTTNLPTSGTEAFGFGLDTGTSPIWQMSDVQISQQM